MRIKDALMPNKWNVLLLYIVSTSLIILSNLFYYTFTQGTTQCASPCANWLDVFGSGGCVAVCVPGTIPSPVYQPLLLWGVALFVFAVIYTLIYAMMRLRKSLYG
ncbi:MAG TPA: hypothetical protein VK158_01395 [Acidobacteriota bacterium]|nr:hypothetical protein [Acidobacteriota bacterium]